MKSKVLNETSGQFLIDGFLLTLDSASYLVQVRKTRVHGFESSVKDLPDWVFHSRFTIWLAEGTAPIQRRAIEGDRIKHKLLVRWGIKAEG
jgi:hypothetical protein